MALAAPALAPVAPVAEASPPTTGRFTPADAAVGLTLLVWATWVTAGTGGREPHRLSVLAALVLVSALLVRPWRALPRMALVLGYGIGLAAVGVVLTAPTGLEGADEAASYVVFGQLVMVLMAWAVDTDRRRALLLALLAFGVLQVAMGWLAFWGGEDPTRPFQGTFFWHNPVGISLAVAAVVGLVVLLSQPRPWRLLGWFTAPLAGAVCLLTTSRASALLLAGGAALLLGLSLVLRRWRDAAKVVAVGALAWGTSMLLVSPVFFPSVDGAGASPLAGTTARAAAEPLAGNTEYRLVTWQLAVDVFKEWPLSGAGFHGFKSAATQVSGEPQMVAHSHNGFLQALADGGLLLAVPFWSGALLVAVVVARRLWATRGREPLLLGAGLALLLLVLHGGMDFDWSYPALLAALAVAIAAALGGPGRTGRGLTVRGELAAAGCCALLLAAAAVGAWDGGLDLNTTVGGSS